MSIAIGDAAFSGFRLIGKRPLSVLAWGVLHLIVIGVPALLLLGSMGSDFNDFVRSMATHAGSTSPTDMSAQWAPMIAFMERTSGLRLLMLALGILLRGVLMAAVIRAVLEPDNKGFFYLRFGMQEIWQIILAIAMTILFVIFFLVVAAVCGLIFAAAGSLPGAAALIVRILAGVLAFWAVIWVALRLSLAPPLTFAAKSFRLFESWKLTKGSAGALFLIVLILVILIWLCELVIVGGIMGVLVANKDALSSLKAGATSPADMLKAMSPMILVGVVVGSLLTGAIHAIFIAPFATAYKQLVPTTPEGAAANF